MRPESLDQAIRDATQILSQCGTQLSRSKVSRISRSYIDAQPPCDFATYILRNAAPGIRSAPAARGRQATQWLDPTADEAISNITSHPKKR